MFLVQNNDNHGVLKELVYVGCDRETAQEHFFSTCSTAISNWAEYTRDDQEVCLDDGYAEFGGGAILFIDTDGITSDAEIAAMIGKYPLPDVQKIKRWVESGEIGEVKTIDEILEKAGRCLDAACSHDICGPILFQAEDDKWYVLTVEGVIGEAAPEYVSDCLEENECQP